MQPGKILYEMEGVTEEVAREALYKASTKLPIKTKIVKRILLRKSFLIEKKPVFVSMEGGKAKTPLWMLGMFPHKYICFGRVRKQDERFVLSLVENIWCL